MRFLVKFQIQIFSSKSQIVTRVSQKMIFFRAPDKFWNFLKKYYFSYFIFINKMHAMFVETPYSWVLMYLRIGLIKNMKSDTC